MAFIGVDAKQELAIAEQAIKDRWEIDERLRNALIGTMGTIMLTSDNPRIKTRAAAVLVACDRVNIAAKALDKPDTVISIRPTVEVEVKTHQEAMTVQELLDARANRN